ncbi:hypothetical protein ACFY8X_19090 [Streptomyces tanashiensis]|uniref:hypothetical protein n=1 Tax=Streptomyces tanashiensis TaxID=67367 RepID=UPI0036EDCE2E
MAANTPSKALLWSGIGVAALGVVGLVAVAVADLGKADQVASVVGAVLAAVGLGLSLWAQFGQRSGGAVEPTQAPPVVAVEATGARSVAVGGSVGTVVTGDRAQVPAAPPAMPSGGTTATGPVTASGERSVAAGGDIGSVSTGDA